MKINEFIKVNDHDIYLFTKLLLYISNLIRSTFILLAFAKCNLNQIELLLALDLSTLDHIEFAVDLPDVDAESLHFRSRLFQVLLILLAALDSCVENENERHDDDDAEEDPADDDTA